MKTEYQKAFAEVLQILEKRGPNEKIVWNEELLENMKSHAKEGVEIIDIDTKKELKELELTEDAKIILAILYEEYRKNPKGKKKEEKVEQKEAPTLKLEEKKEEVGKEKNKKEPEPLWYPVLPKKEPLVKRVWKKIKSIFKRSVF